jgi:hypothetical protein
MNIIINTWYGMVIWVFISVFFTIGVIQTIKWVCNKGKEE